MASVQRHRPKPWVQANRKVPLSSSRASTGAPTNAPISAGTTCRMNPFARNPYMPLKPLTGRSRQMSLPGGRRSRRRRRGAGEGRRSKRAHGHCDEQHGHPGQRGAVLAPGDPGHPPPRHRPQVRVLIPDGRAPAPNWAVSAVISSPPTVRRPGRGPGRAAPRRRAHGGRRERSSSRPTGCASQPAGTGSSAVARTSRCA